MALPSWAPSLPKVASYVPGRTLVAATDGYGNALSTFTADTHPTVDQVTSLIGDACAWVLVKTGPVHDSLADVASACAAKWCASQVEQAYPDNSADAGIAALLFTQATQLRDELQLANEAITGMDPEDPQAHLFPVYHFPDPFLGGDLEFN